MQALRANLTRTILSLLGVTVGIFAIIAVFTLVDSLEKGIKDSMSFLGDRVIYVEKWPMIFENDYPWWRYFQRPTVDMNEFRALERRLKNHQGIAIFVSKGNQTLKYQNNSMNSVSMQGVTYEFNRISDVPIGNGRYFTPQEIEAGRTVAIIGINIAENLFPGMNPIGKEIKVKGHKFVVIGVMEKQGDNLLGAPSNDYNFITPYTAFTRLYLAGGQRGAMPRIGIKGLEHDPGLIELESETRGTMRNIRGLRPAQEDNFALNRPEVLANQISGMFGVITFAGGIIGSFSILVGAFGIANIMFVSVKERTPLIGIQKSLGAKNYFILFQFLFEAVFLSIIGGLAGIFLVYLLTFVPQDTLDIVLTARNITIGMGVSAFVGVLSGIVPAALASRMDPVTAIRAQ